VRLWLRLGVGERERVGVDGGVDVDVVVCVLVCGEMLVIVHVDDDVGGNLT
jgi:hypothetical protein